MAQSDHPNQIGLYRERCRPIVTQQELAGLMNTSCRSIQTWENKGVAKAGNLLRLLEIFVQCGVITSCTQAEQFWNLGSQREAEWPVPAEIADLFSQQPESTSLSSQAGESVTFVALQQSPQHMTDVVAYTTSSELHVTHYTPLLTAATKGLQTDKTDELAQIVVPQSWFTKLHMFFWEMRVVLLVLGASLCVSVVAIGAQPGSTPVFPKRGPIPLVLNGQLSSQFAFHQGSSFESHYSVDLATNTLIIAAGSNTDQHKTNVSAPVVTLPVRGDFDASVHATALFPSSDCCQHVGIGVRSPSDPTVWIRITRDHDQKLTVNDNRGEKQTTTHTVIVASSLDLRIQRIGNSFHFFYRESGPAWIAFSKPMPFDLPQDAELFLVNYSMWSDHGSAGEFRDLVVR